MKTITIPVRSKGNWEVECARLTERQRELTALGLEILAYEMREITKKSEEMKEAQKEIEETLLKLNAALILDMI